MAFGGGDLFKDPATDTKAVDMGGVESYTGATFEDPYNVPAGEDTRSFACGGAVVVFALSVILYFIF